MTQLALDFRRRCPVRGCVRALHGSYVDPPGTPPERTMSAHWNGRWSFHGDDMGTDPAEGD